ncbi:MAG: ABC transporter ATP-binding protein/permease, partial [Arcanobacterium sp.]|nr:ABC transporter ATP-binding protein/permease [Arcanobacterium sp.]
SPERPLPLPASPLTFELKNITIQYTGAETPVLSNVTMHLKPSSLVAIIGPTGSGKSSVAKLFPRLLDPTSGAVLANGINVRDLDVHELRSRVAFVPQHAFLFSGTIASNVAGLPRELPRELPDDSHSETSAATEAPPTAHSHAITRSQRATHYDEDRVIQALKAAQAWEFVNELDGGIHAAVESGGQNFSGGQRQRLTIARAIYRCLPDSHTGQRQADLLIFDDSFSALDFATDAALRTHLHSFIGNVAVLVIAQRIATIRNAQEILVLSNGHAEAHGTHSELLRTSPTYADIVRSQLTEEEAQ